MKPSNEGNINDLKKLFIDIKLKDERGFYYLKKYIYFEMNLSL